MQAAQQRYSRAFLLGQETIAVRADHHDLPRDVAAHDHDFYEIAIVTAGEGRHHTAGGEAVVRAGSALLIPPNQWHRYSECKSVAVYDCFIGPEVFERELSLIVDDTPLITALARGPFPSPQRVDLDEERLAVAVSQLDALGDTFRGARLTALAHLLMLIDVLAETWAPTGPCSRRSAGHLHPAVAEAATLLETSPQFPWTLAELAATVNVERTHLVRLFQKELGTPPIAYMRQLRQQAAARLLVQTRLPISEIGTQVGWDDPAHFARQFKASFGLSPSAYRGRARSGASAHR
ncbi:AraC family transcriptional regulator [Microbacterium azadirachtae]|uniref:AraC-like ligand binding domain-containing protein n=1 Tax=Microbacterium azadirachtae TaxID=582680 RepID=A0A0F0KTP1_9MICO|nr:helix-turn-helix domain-containing protein [Microbacterium azadirachtae]KJL24262.1 HTH-type transcriptional activator Btr [Microbacterium azadirachtae]SDL34885.1 AraC-like ligand binding domain-containing protein [Microbacterium azadirachtae]SEF65477.1 AraC-like ligand binding domain-containing protein [Microbacterium azadirachtae]SEF66309.1 AraC-like ligand binding domain-containing protein [Microbacterium azadirachtae]SFR37479.1 AraC-like ligand binding domain-containing protein [Microbac